MSQDASALDWPPEWPSYDKVIEIARAIAGSVDGGEELASFAFKQALLNPRKGAALHDGWFWTVMRNKRRELARRARCLPFLPIPSNEANEELPSPNATPEVRAMRREAASELLNAIAQISGRRREVLKMKYFGSMSNAAIAEALGVSVSSIERDHTLALEALGKSIEDHRSVFGARIGALLVASADKALTGSPTAVATTPVALNIWGWVVLSMVTLLVSWMAWPLLFGSTDDALLGAFVEPSEPSLEDGTSKSDAVAALVPAGETAGRSQHDTQSLPNPPVAPLELSGSVADGHRGAVGADVEKLGTRTFHVTLEVDGQRSSEWTALVPVADPDGYEQAGLESPQALQFDQKSDSGEFSFKLPESIGRWLFRFSNSSTGLAVWLLDSANDGEDRLIQFETGAARLESPSQHPELSKERSLLIVNPQPAVWVVSAVRSVDEESGAWIFPGTCAGEASLKEYFRARDPDRWPVVLGPWSVLPGQDNLLK